MFGTDAVDSGLWRVSSAGGEPVELTTPDELGDHVFPEMLPGGQAVVFTIRRWRFSGSNRGPDTVEDAQLAVVSLAGGEPKVLNLRGSQPRYVSTGHIVYGVDGTLQAVGFDVDRLGVSGNPVAVVEGVDMKDSGAVNFDVSDTGTLLYVGSGSQRTLVWVHRDGREEPLPGHSPANLYWGRLSPDGARVAVNRRENRNQDIWVYHLSPATQTRLTFHPADETNPLWTRDGNG